MYLYNLLLSVSLPKLMIPKKKNLVFNSSSDYERGNVIVAGCCYGFFKGITFSGILILPN